MLKDISQKMPFLLRYFARVLDRKLDAKVAGPTLGICFFKMGL